MNFFDFFFFFDELTSTRYFIEEPTDLRIADKKRKLVFARRAFEKFFFFYSLLSFSLSSSLLSSRRLSYTKKKRKRIPWGECINNRVYKLTRLKKVDYGKQRFTIIPRGNYFRVQVARTLIGISTSQ